MFHENMSFTIAMYGSSTFVSMKTGLCWWQIQGHIVSVVWKRSKLQILQQNVLGFRLHAPFNQEDDFLIAQNHTQPC